MPPTIVDLNEIIPGLSINFSKYWESERDVIEPALVDAGYYDIGRWFSPEKDSFGPLSRGAMATTPAGKRVLVCYG